MKILPALGLALLLTPLAAFAEDAPPVAPPVPPAAAAPLHPQLTDQEHVPFEEMHQQMQGMHQQMQALHRQARAQILASLTPAHRALLANVVGQLAIAPNPDTNAAARQLDAALSQAEGQAILRIHQQVMTQMKAGTEAMRRQMMAHMETAMTPEAKAAFEKRRAEHATKRQFEMRLNVGGPQSAAANDPGHILLRLASHTADEQGPMMMFKQIEAH